MKENINFPANVKFAIKFFYPAKKFYVYLGIREEISFPIDSKSKTTPVKMYNKTIILSC
jgi:hypothetical protein